MDAKSIIKDIVATIKETSSVYLYDNPQEVDEWNSWYKGKVDSFHNYVIYNGKKSVKCERASMQMAKKVCEDWADLLINEKTDIGLDSQQAQKTLYEVLEEIKFWKKANKGIEKAFALGMGALVLNVNKISLDQDGNIIRDTGKVDLQFANRTQIVPITIDNDGITECAFINECSDHTEISVHLLDKSGFYRIHNIVAKGSGSNLSFDIQNPSDYWEFNTLSDKKWFFILQPNIVNNIDINSPFGISIFANSIDKLKFLDIVFDGYNVEFLLGRKRIFISAANQQVDTATGEIIDVFDSRDVVFYMLPEGADGKPYIQNDTQELRTTSFNDAIQRGLDMLSDGVGFGQKHYKFDSGSVATATQVISENSKLFRTLKKHEILIEDVLIEFVKTLCYALNKFTPIQIKEPNNVEIKFDDSIIEDKKSEKENDRLDVALNVMSKVEYRMKWYNEDRKTAEKNLEEISEYSLPDYEPSDNDKSNEDNKSDTNTEDEDNVK